MRVCLLTGTSAVELYEAFGRFQDIADANAELVPRFDDFPFGDRLITDFDGHGAVAGLVELDEHAGNQFDDLLDPHLLPREHDDQRHANAQHALAEGFEHRLRHGREPTKER